jgi:DNA ligase-1
MPSPAKRQKKTDFNSSPSKGRSLDFFFGKQNKAVGTSAVVEEKRDTTTTAEYQLSPTGAEEQERSSITDWQLSSEGIDDQERTDEEFARQLQAEWNNEGAQRPLAPEDTLSPHGTTTETMTDQLGSLKRKSNGTTSIVAREPGVEKVQIGAVAGDKAKATTISLQSGGAAEDTISAGIPMDESSLTFQTSKYIEDLKRHWASEGGSASYALLTSCFVLVNGTSSRIKIVDILVNFLRLVIEADPESLLPAVRNEAPLGRSRELTSATGVASHQFYITPLCLDGTGRRKLVSVYGRQDWLRNHYRYSKSTVQEAWRRWRCRLRGEEATILHASQARASNDKKCIPNSRQACQYERPRLP